MKHFKRIIWILRAAMYLRRKVDIEWAYALYYAESLYETYVVQDDDECTPQDAVGEDMSYWDHE